MGMEEDKKLYDNMVLLWKRLPKNIRRMQEDERQKAIAIGKQYGWDTSVFEKN